MGFNFLSAWVGQYSMHDMRVKLFRHIMRQDIAFFDRNPVGRLITRFTSDVQVLTDLFATGVVVPGVVGVAGLPGDVGVAGGVVFATVGVGFDFWAKRHSPLVLP